ncbi:adenylate kinase [Entomoplasma ellychniae]|uniref:Adenylate kinase n=1 Tax=Entomoplasma ellychniae TaxID=2114 RepID=A0A8E2QWG1_9MOLU|nr:nucleoside monophosphate kinase [Entomoplasma ellychniae]PPE04941.1 adenylate kinase [Entomoplasma ellychniae]
MNIMLLGAPGCGKGTLAEKLINKKGFTQLSTGDLMRKEISKKSVLGIQCIEYINAGKLVPDEVTNGIVKEFLKEKHNGLIFDGYPRTLNQAKALEEILKELGSSISKIIYIDVAKEVLLSRISGRLICPTCKISYHTINRKPKIEWICDKDQTELIRRVDDEPNKVEVRLKAYAKQTAPLIKYFSTNSGFLKIVDSGTLTPEETYQKVMETF